MPLVKGGQNLPTMVGIGLTGLPNIGGASGPPGPPGFGITDSVVRNCALRNLPEIKKMKMWLLHEFIKKNNFFSNLKIPRSPIKKTNAVVCTEKFLFV